MINFRLQIDGIEVVDKSTHYELKKNNRTVTCDKNRDDFNDTIIEFKQILEHEQNKLVEA